MQPDIFDKRFIEWQDSLRGDKTSFDFTTIVKSLPSEARLASIAIGRMIEALFTASTEQLNMSQLSVISGELPGAAGNNLGSVDPDAYTRLLEAILVIAHSLKKTHAAVDDMSSIQEFVARLQNKRLTDCIQFLTNQDIVLGRHEWYDYISNNLMGPSWPHIASIYDIEAMPTASVATLMNTLHHTLLQNQSTDVSLANVTLPPDLSS